VRLRGGARSRVKSPLRPPSESSARDHLANERTFLAYLRTALACIAFGFGIARFAIAFRELALVHSHTESGPSVVFGESMVAVGVVVAVFGTWRFLAERHALLTGTTRGLSPRVAGLIAGVIVVFGIFTAYDLVRYWAD
jgi:putative membrane protein